MKKTKTNETKNVKNAKSVKNVKESGSKESGCGKNCGTKDCK